MNIIKTVAGKLLILVTLPLLALVFATGTISRDGWLQYKSASETEKLMNLATALGEVVHALQVERANSVGFAQSKGQKFGDDMARRRMATDTSQQNLKNVAGSNEFARQALDGLAGLPRAREEISALRKPGDETAAYFTDTIGVLVKSLAGLATQDANPVLGRKLTAYLSLVKGKEYAGQERALGARVFVADAMTATDYRAFLERVHKQDGDFATFRTYASDKDVKAFEGVLTRDYSRDVEKMRGAALERNTSGKFGVSGEAWVRQTTARIDGLHEVEQGLSGDIVTTAHDMAASAYRNLIIYITLTIACVGVTLVMSWLIIRNLLRQLGGEPEYAAQVARDVAGGNLPADVVVKAGDQSSMLYAMQNMVAKLKQMIEGQRRIVEAANHGNFDARIDLNGLQGFQKDMGEGLNQLVVTTGASIDDVVRVMGAVSEGDLTKSIDKSYEGAFGKLKDYTNNTVAKLSQVVAEVNGGAEAIASASEQVNVTAQSLSQAASEQAASVEETSASVEQMTSSIGQNTENSKVTDGMATKAAQEATEGGEAVKATVAAMNQIAKKILIIDDIAYQTNLLALNAAIEAARAGEHGKGFAVVAAEVRKLAERSQVAAQEIGEVATSSVELAEKAGKLLDEMVPNIRKTSDLVQEITAASEEQSSGVGQINSAMAQLSQVTQQNASSSEELAATAEEMSGQAEQLQQTMSFFKLEGLAGERETEPRRHAAKAPARTPARRLDGDRVRRSVALATDAALEEAQFTRF
ncbi:nitrate- and nitrite sensing domain-containing protein [Noviherbaspirillum sp.]|jgi:methyl-accepting chemotaxis protein|uniref:methyl-accepting chemotaxis protein n=1 Tax=Noviherbaspirillum sp. TaxID=1926288 RepID=UPI0025F70CB2|nr:nitrate- and nitrite sensing domain-containing protein [Noviherbaspirillum sp.]